MQVLELDILNPSGLHARPAALLVEAATRAEARVRLMDVRRPEREVDAKSILGVLSLGISQGGRVRFTIDGADEASAAEELRSLVTGGFGELER